MSGYRILVVDDVSENIQVAMNILKRPEYHFSFAINGEQALELTKTNNFDLILLDIMMPVMNGFEACLQLKKQEKTQDIPIIFLTAKADIDSIRQAFESGGVDYITKPFHSEELIARVRTHLELYASKKLLQQHNLSLKHSLIHNEQRLITELEENQKEMIYVLTELMESTSDETGQHIRRVAEYSRLLGHYHPSISEDDANVVYHAAPMHDIGKMTIPQEILHKAGPLTEEEYEVMKTHTTNAYNLLKISDRKLMKAAEVIAYQHHEKWNGTGYPQGLAGEDIHLFARIVALADVFDALTHKRLYKDAWPIEDAVNFITDQKNSHFDPQLVDIFIENLDEFIAISNR